MIKAGIAFLCHCEPELEHTASMSCANRPVVLHSSLQATVIFTSGIMCESSDKAVGMESTLFKLLMWVGAGLSVSHCHYIC